MIYKFCLILVGILLSCEINMSANNDFQNKQNNFVIKERDDSDSKQQDSSIIQQMDAKEIASQKMNFGMEEMLAVISSVVSLVSVVILVMHCKNISKIRNAQTNQHGIN